MPMIRGRKARTKKGREKNFHEFRHGKMYAKIRKKHGKAAANAAMEAAVLGAGRKKKGAKKK